MKYRVGDFETASNANLKKTGAWRYAEDPTTEILCFSWGALGASPYCFCPMGNSISDHPIRELLLREAADASILWIAHNAQFEKAIWRNLMLPMGFPDIPNDRWHDTMAVCAMKVLPQKLEDAVRVLGLKEEKDMEGSRLTISLSKPDRGGNYDRTPETLGLVGAYCNQDVRSEGELHHRIGDFQPGERRVWLLDQTINERGVRLDMEFVRAAQQIVADASKPLAQEFATLTGGLGVGQRDKVIAWAVSQGVEIPDMKKETIAALVGSDEDEDDEEQVDSRATELPEQVRRALKIRQLIGSASIKKLGAMEGVVCSDGRARGLLQYHGAGPGRWAGRLLQPQNFPRGTLKLDGEAPDPSLVVDAIMTRDWQYVEMMIGPAVETVVSSLRHAIIAAPGRVLAAGDFAQIEARVVLALAGQWDKVALLAGGHDVYIDMAQAIYRRPIDKKHDPIERTIGKFSVLGLGFGMGAAKFHDRYANGQDMEFCQGVVDTYRQEWAPEVPKLWYGLEHAAVRTVHEGTPHEAYGCQYKLEDGWLTCRIPSGRKLYYWNPQPTRRAMPWDATDIRPSFTYEAKKLGRWVVIDSFGAMDCQNIVTALARDILVSAMFRLEANGYPICLTVHDEAVTESLIAHANASEMEQIMSDSPPWALEMRVPVKTEAWVAERYKK